MRLGAFVHAISVHRTSRLPSIPHRGRCGQRGRWRASGSAAAPPVVFVLGGPGSGKGTQCAKLVRDYDLVEVCVGELLRNEVRRGTELGRGVEAIMQKGGIVPGHVTMQLLKSELRSKVGTCKGILIDGFPRAMDQALAFEEVITSCDFVLFFHCDREEMVTRLLNRGKTSGRADDTEDIVRMRLETYMEKTLPVIEHYRQKGLLREVNSGSGSPEDVYCLTKKAFGDEFL